MHLKKGAVLKRGEYRIEKLLGQGGFGITYLAIQSGLDRKVAIKEFFMKDLCERDADTSSVTLGTSGSRQTVIRFKEKFIREAKTIASLRHPNIVNIHDVFEENGTAYYVMEYHDGGSLSSLDLPLSVDEASGYIRQIASALSYLHKRNTMHLDVKPSNILLDESGNAVLIDFGVSKHYDAEDGSQTSSTPVGLSRGYAPLEQNKAGGVSQFTPSSDIYSLGATFFKLITGHTPPEADDVYEDGLPPFPSSVPSEIASVIEKSMQPRRKDRPQSIEEFLGLLDAALISPSSDKTPSDTVDVEIVDAMPTENTELGSEPVPETDSVPSPKKSSSKWLWWLLALFVAFTCAAAVLFMGNVANTSRTSENPNESTYYRNNVLCVNGVKYPMAYVEGDTFQMGSTDSDADYDETNVHSVTLSSYRLGQFEVTQELWEAVMGSNPSQFKGPKRPVENVSCEDCDDFIKELNRLTGQNFRLPTEAEWEYAARGGKNKDSYKYSGSNDLADVAWYCDNSSSETHDVGKKTPNSLGLYDMSGNVWEWCYDWYGAYPSDHQLNPKGPDSGSYRVLRGGSWYNFARYCRVSNRNYYAPSIRSGYHGFRLCL